MVTTIVSGVLNLLPSITLPDWLGTSISAVSGAFSHAGLYGEWLPLTAIVGGIAFIGVCSGIAWAIKLFRVGVSMGTGGGGAT